MFANRGRYEPIGRKTPTKRPIGTEKHTIYHNSDTVRAENITKAPDRYRKHGFGTRYNEKRSSFLNSFSSAPPGARTLDPNIKSVVLYQLS